MNTRIPPLVLAGAMVLTLCACSPKEPNPTPDPTPTESMNVIVVTPGAEPIESASVVVVDPSAEPTQSMNVIPPEESEGAAEPLTSQDPGKGSELAPSPEPTETPVQTQPIITPEPTPAAKNLTAAQVYDKVSAVATDTVMVDCSFVLDAFYPDLSEADLEDFVLYMPDMSAKIEEILIGRVASGRMDAVKAACEARQQGMKEEAEFYASTGDYVDSYKLVVNGDWILFAVVQDPAEAEAAFRDAVK